MESIGSQSGVNLEPTESQHGVDRSQSGANRESTWSRSGSDRATGQTELE